MKETPKNLNYLGVDQIYVFGSNLAGKHGAGSAKKATEFFDAEYGNPEGLQGKCYAIPTKDEKIETLPISMITIYVERFLNFVKANPEYDFLVIEIGCMLAGYKPIDIAPLFIRGKHFPNLSLPKSFINVIDALIDGDGYRSRYTVGEKCFVCKEEAYHKVNENVFDDDPIQTRHELTTYLCCKHFQMIMGNFAKKMCDNNKHPSF
tara:strand:+ start:1537 stop:2154 length:618 start_codon:yes stop_codon:yes gene_type:complete